MDDIKRDLVISCLHYNGKNRTKLSDAIWTEAYFLCDGLGKIDSVDAEDADWGCWHIRNSTPEAINNAAEFLMNNVTLF